VGGLGTRLGIFEVRWEYAGLWVWEVNMGMRTRHGIGLEGMSEEAKGNTSARSCEEDVWLLAGNSN